MKIAHHPTDERGVSQLMYVGDDGLPVSSDRHLIAVGLVAGYGIAKTRGVLRLGICAAALYLLFGQRYPAA